MQVSFQKSAVVYALRGRCAEEMVGRYTTWFRGERFFLLGDGTRRIKLPVHDRLEYLGIILSYNAFEMQTAQHRSAKAAANFGMLTNVLRVNGALSTSVRVRIYRACVWSSASYGLVAVGFTAGSLQHIISATSKQFRKVLRMHEKGTTNRSIQSAADLDVAAILVEQAKGQLQAVSSRGNAEGHERSANEYARAVGILHQLETFIEQASQGSLRAVVSDQAPKVMCPVCGLEFYGDYGLQMHIKAKHAELNVASQIDFVRSKHSLFGTPTCRLCHVRCYNWQSLEKHITEGSCSRIKEALAKNQTIEGLLEVIKAEEIRNPPVPPDETMPDLQLILDSQHPVLTCPLHEVPEHLDVFQMLRCRCGLCGQLVRETNTIKTHWRTSHPRAWKLVKLDAEQVAKSVKVIFSSPCKFCGLVNKQPEMHSVRCSAYFQVSALRKLARGTEQLQDLEGVKQKRPRQHLRTPEYKTWSLETTPLGKAFGVQTTLSTSLPAQKPSLDAACVPAHPLMPSAKTGPNQAPLGLHRFFARSGARGEADVGGAVVPPEVDVIWTCAMRLRNPHSLCYVNSSVQAILHLLYTAGQEYYNLEFLHQACQASVRSGVLLNLSTNLMFRSILPGWTYDAVQRDAGEYAMLLLEALRMLRCEWQLLIGPPHGDVPAEVGGCPLMMKLPEHTCSLQDVIDRWHRPSQGQLRLVCSNDGLLVIQLDRYDTGSKVFTDVDFAEAVRLPVRMNHGVAETSCFVVYSVVFHTGRSVQSGHYQAVLRVGSSWRLCDDDAHSVPFTLTGHVRRNVYLLFLKQHL